MLGLKLAKLFLKLLLGVFKGSLAFSQHLYSGRLSLLLLGQTLAGGLELLLLSRQQALLFLKLFTGRFQGRTLLFEAVGGLAEFRKPRFKFLAQMGPLRLALGEVLAVGAYAFTLGL